MTGRSRAGRKACCSWLLAPDTSAWSRRPYHVTFPLCWTHAALLVPVLPTSADLLTCLLCSSLIWKVG